MSRIRHERIGDVFLENFDEGIVKTLEGVLIGDDYFLPLSKAPTVQPPLYTELAADPDLIGKPMPGIPFIFANPGEAVQRYVIPCIRVRREDPSPALERWGSLQDKYRAPAPGEPEIVVQYGNRTKRGYAKYEMQPAGWPYDIPYTITIETNGVRARLTNHILLKHCMGIFGPYGVVTVTDDMGRDRKYNVFGEGPSNLDIIGDLRDRTIISALSLRVAAELDVQPQSLHGAMISPPTVTGCRQPIIEEE